MRRYSLLVALLASGFSASALAQQVDTVKLVPGTWQFNAEKTAKLAGPDGGAGQYAAAFQGLALTFDFQADGALQATVHPTGRPAQKLTGRWGVLERKADGELIVEWSYGGTEVSRTSLRFNSRDEIVAASLKEDAKMVLSRVVADTASRPSGTSGQ